MPMGQMSPGLSCITYYKPLPFSPTFHRILFCGCVKAIFPGFHGQMTPAFSRLVMHKQTLPCGIS